MKLIAHRANLRGPNNETENKSYYIDNCILKGFDVEVDVWYVGNHLYLGHDSFNELISLNFLEERKDYLWIHCKNLQALCYLMDSDFNYFWHENDTCTLTSKKYIWTFPHIKSINCNKQILLDFEYFDNTTFNYYKSLNIYGLCGDYLELY